MVNQKKISQNCNIDYEISDLPSTIKSIRGQNMLKIRMIHKCTTNTNCKSQKHNHLNN